MDRAPGRRRRPCRGTAPWHRAAALLATLLCPFLWAAPASSQDAVPTVRFTVERFEIEGDNPLPADQTSRVLAPFLGEHEGLEGLLSAADALEKALRDRGYSFHRVSLPAQTMKSGVVRLAIIEFTIGAITVTGNEHFSEENVRASLPELAVGAAPNTKRLARNLGQVNEHPAKEVKLSFTESKEERRLHADVKVTDEKPWNVFVAFDNTGTDETGDYRLSFGGQYNNLWNRDHILTGTYTTSPTQTDDVSQWGVFYLAPIYAWGADLAAYYSRSNVDSGTLTGVNGGAFDVSGAGQFVGGRARYRQLKHGRLDQMLSLAVDDKLFENDAIFGGVNTAVDVRSRPLSLGWHGKVQQARSLLTVNGFFAVNIPGGGDNDNATYEASRAGASVDWNAVRGDAEYDFYFSGGWLLRGMFNGQYAGEPMIAGEQFGLGGARSVRGFDERATTGDDGYRASGEVWTPPIPKLEGLRALAFLDGGHVTLYDPQPGIADSQTLSSFGVGLRWQWKKWVAASFDLARVISGGTQLVPGTGAVVPIEEKGSMRGHFTIFVRY